jgi:hypothetical protein
VVRVGALSSDARVQTRPETTARAIRVGDWAFEAVPAYGELRLGVRLLPTPALALREDLYCRIGSSPTLRHCEPDEEGCVSVEVRTTHCSIVDARGFALADAFRTLDPETPTRIVERLERRARWRHGLRLANRDPASRVAAGLRVGLLRQSRGGWRPALSPARRGSGDADDRVPVFRRGNLVALEISHSLNDVDLYIYVLDFGLTDEVSQLFPPAGGEECIPPFVTIRPGILPGEEFELWLPEGWAARGQERMSFLKVFATTHPVDFDWLRTDVRWPSPPRAGSPSLARLLAMESGGPVLRHRDEDWGTSLQPIRLLP